MTYTGKPALLACLLALGCAADVKSGSQPGTSGAVAGRAGGSAGSGGAVRGAGSGGATASGGATGSGGAGGASAMTAATTPVVISEIMYHPVFENGPVDRHEFVEIYNRSAAAVELAGWKLAGDVMFTFPAGAKIAPKQFLVVAKDRTALAAVASYGLKVGDLLGDYTGQLDNGKGVVSLSDAAGAGVERVAYSDEFPWPVAADALGAGESWLSADNLPNLGVMLCEYYAYRGWSEEGIPTREKLAQLGLDDISV